MDSRGVRSAATFISTANLNILIDPGIGLKDKHYGLEPCQSEIIRFNECLDKIKQKAEKAHIIILSHFHKNHCLDDINLYKQKKLLIKDYTHKIDKRQKETAELFVEKIIPVAEIEIADGKEFKFGDIKITFSKPILHHTYWGYVLQISIADEIEKFLFATDTQGTYETDEMDFILKEDASLILCDLPQRPSEETLTGLAKIITNTKLKKLIIDHHIVRDTRFKNYLGGIYLLAEEWNVSIMTGAEYLGLPVELLEANRKSLSQS